MTSIPSPFKSTTDQVHNLIHYSQIRHRDPRIQHACCRGNFRNPPRIIECSSLKQKVVGKGNNYCAAYVGHWSRRLYRWFLFWLIASDNQLCLGEQRHWWARLSLFVYDCLISDATSALHPCYL
ncbi:hypothetical protein J6590_088089 [Homalodisca vitripennis]|nr:hypothetical protein J6590_088089 [Homalodisca vitripennis]